MTHTIDRNIFEQIHVTTTADTWHFTANSSIVVDDDGILEDSGSNNRLQVDGKIVASASAIQSEGNGSVIDVGTSAVLVGHDGIIAVGDQSAVHNEGSIYANDRGILATSNVDNRGSIYATFGIVVEGADISVTNQASGRIVASQVAVDLYTAIDQETRFVNHGHVTAADGGLAIKATEGNETIVNDGRIVGDIDLGDGNDVIDVRDGIVKGEIHGGNGDDILITDRSDIALSEEDDQGFDVVKSSVSYTLTDNVDELFLVGNDNTTGVGNDLSNEMVGSKGDNVLKGAAGTDAMIGRKGDDRLFGGLGSDTFWIRVGDGHDVITDFHHGEDHILISDWMDGFNQLMRDSHVDHGNLVIETAHQSLTLLGVHRFDINADDFLFGRPS